MTGLLDRNSLELDNIFRLIFSRSTLMAMGFAAASCFVLLQFSSRVQKDMS